jgi:heme exporter protein A
MNIEVKSVYRYFGTRRILDNINLELSDYGAAVITGPNGSGKSTLIRIICGLLRPTSGQILLTDNGKIIAKEKHHKYISLVAPYLELYDQLSAHENILLFAKLYGIQNLNYKISALFEKLDLSGYEKEQVKTYSSGMKQRLKYIFALLSEPYILILDEPTSNLDENGIHLVNHIMEEQKKQKILIYATNDKHDLKYGDKIIELHL